MNIFNFFFVIEYKKAQTSKKAQKKDISISKDEDGDDQSGQSERSDDNH